jgi:hypothetical protein
LGSTHSAGRKGHPRRPPLNVNPKRGIPLGEPLHDQEAVIDKRVMCIHDHLFGTSITPARIWTLSGGGGGVPLGGSLYFGSTHTAGRRGRPPAAHLKG